jgi:hypothetical protein
VLGNPIVQRVSVFADSEIFPMLKRKCLKMPYQWTSWGGLRAQSVPLSPEPLLQQSLLLLSQRS